MVQPAGAAPAGGRLHAVRAAAPDRGDARRPVLNLLVPAGFYLLARRLLGRWPALAALSIFLSGRRPACPENTAGVYSPWAWPRNVAQGLYFLGALALHRTTRDDRVRWPC